jgi:hypothetical protein
VPAGALTEAACSVDLAPPPSASRGRWRVARSERCGGSLPGYLLRALVGRDVRGEAGLYPPPRAGRPPLAPLFALAAPEGVYLSLLTVCPSLPLFCARRAPAKMMRSQKIPSGPRYVQTSAEYCRGLGAFFVCGAWFRFGTYYVQNALDKTLQSTPFFSTERYLSALGVRHAVAPYPVLLRSAPVLGYVPLLRAWHGLAVGGVVRSLGF